MSAIFGELSLILFTVFAQLAVGMVLFANISCNKEDTLSLNLWKYSFFVLVIAGLASFTHLTNPFNAFYTITQIGSSWMSREIVCVGIFGALLLLHYLKKGTKETGYASLAMGLVLVYVMAMVYASVSSMPMWNLSSTLLAFYGTTFLLGAAFCLALLKDTDSKCLNSSTKTLLVLGLILSLSAKMPWLSTVIANPSLLIPDVFISSFCCAIVIYVLCLIAGSVMLLNRKYFSTNILIIACALLVIGEIFGRALFFAAQLKLGV